MNYSFKKLDEEKHLIGGVAYTAMAGPDKQGDEITDPEELFEGMISFAKNGMVIGEQHQGQADAYVVEQFMTEDASVVKHGTTIPPYSWWLTVKIVDEALWKRVKNKSLTGLSIAGKASTDA